MNQGGLDIQINADDLYKQISQLQKSPVELYKPLVAAVRKGNAAMKAGVQARVRKFSGSTARSITSRVKIGQFGSATGITGPSDHGSNPRAHVFRFMQDGSYWKNDNNSQPWVYDLLDWVRAKFHPNEKDEVRTAFALARSIKQKGIKGTPIARPVMVERMPLVLGLLKKAVEEIIEGMKVK